MQRRLESVTRIGKRIGLSDEKGVLVAVFVALIVVACTVAVYYVWFGPKPEPYSSISLLDTQQQAIDYPQILVANQNSTFSVYVEVANHQNSDQTYQVRIKIAKSIPISIPDGVAVDPVKTVDFTVQNGQTQQSLVAITENTVGAYSVIYELWQHNTDGYVFTQNYCVLNIQVIT